MLRRRFDVGAYLCVGLDPEPAKFPARFAGDPDAVFHFCRDIVDATAGYVAAFKPNLAFYLSHGAAGLRVLEQTVSHIRQVYPSVPVILDANWGDTESTNNRSVKFAKRLDVQAVTLNPYVGMDALKPFLQNFFCFIVTKTSNPGSDEFQGVLARPYISVTTGRAYPNQDWARKEAPAPAFEDPLRSYLYVANRAANSWDRGSLRVQQRDQLANEKMSLTHPTKRENFPIHISASSLNGRRHQNRTTTTSLFLIDS